MILASTSPRRKEILSMINTDFSAESPIFDEKTVEQNRFTPSEYVMYISKQKALSLQSRYPHKTIIGADTIVVLDGVIYGKPKNQADAFDMLKRLSGQKHQVLTGVTIIKDHHIITFFDICHVIFNTLSDNQISDYIETKEPMDKAGAYGIQGHGRSLVCSYEGDFYTIMGLPLIKLKKALLEFENN